MVCDFCGLRIMLVCKDGGDETDYLVMICRMTISEHKTAARALVFGLKPCHAWQSELKDKGSDMSSRAHGVITGIATG